ncbi:chemotaxis protein CheA [Gynuella sunshinyii]|uniref:Chemotaxis protein CheA n=1 Tax=Gynuella sunshinyii YC6258 TaxID=1445510 RepID=A0A0C5VSB4_9GAMM|nr:chemotaxis protein CheA [Gynuella sunshinyii]AJQ97111.1 chemotaxis protein histidine kinase and related kinase [Gynuella sunshinyii YC6258]
MNLDAALKTYIVESREMLQEMEDILLRIEGMTDQTESLNSIFRAAHTIKGSAGLFGLDGIVGFTHHVETLLDQCRSGDTPITEKLVALLLQCSDHIGRLIDDLETGIEALSPELQQQGNQLIAQLQQIYSPAPAKTPTPAQPEKSSSKPVSPDRPTHSELWHISLRFGLDSLRDGMDPLSFLRYLGTLGEINRIQLIDHHIPDFDKMDPESCYLGFELSYQSDADQNAIEEVFEFIRQDSHVCVLPPHADLDDFARLIGELPENDEDLVNLLVQCGSLSSAEADTLKAPPAVTDETVTTPPPETPSAINKPETIPQAQNTAPPTASRVSSETQSIRVDADKLDHLINLVGELVIAGAGASLNAANNGDTELLESMSTLTRLVEEVRDSALQLRMVQIGGTFNRFHRVVRDVSKELNKDIKLVITGADTELDKTVVEKIGDPLMHLVRNSIDHGIEPPETRVAAGKPATGTVQLNAYHDSGSIVIEISDDGGGLNRERILAKAIRSGLVSAEQPPDDAELFKLIFEPGFSTAEAVSNLSGRGVGMDVVKRNITALRGSVEVDSEAGKGTVFQIRLPLTLAIIDGFMVGVGQSSFVVPLDIVIECIELTNHISAADSDRDYLDLRGEVLPYVRLRDMFAISGKPPERESVVVVNYAGVKAGLVVDRLMGEFQTVIKPLGKIFSHLKGISGSSILGNGDVALIIDVPGLIQQITALENTAYALPKQTMH